jgi:hypothetical protein
VNARAAGIIDVAVNFSLGFAFVHSGAAGWLWSRVERDVSWRTGPTASGVFMYFAIYWGAWLIMNRVIGALCHPEVLRRICVTCRAAPDPSEYLRMTDLALLAAKALTTSCAMVAIQVLMPGTWLWVTLATLLLAMLVNAYIVRESLRRTLTAWAWSGAGVAMATLLIHPWFVGQPLFIVRLAVVMTLWDWLGERLGVTRRLMRIVPSLYAGSSGWMAAQARVTR